MTPHRHIAIIGGPGMSNAQRMSLHVLALSSHCGLIVLPEHFRPEPVAPPPVEMLIKITAPEISPYVAGELRETRRDRTHPNEPYYRKFQKRRKERW